MRHVQNYRPVVCYEYIGSRKSSVTYWVAYEIESFCIRYLNVVIYVLKLVSIYRYECLYINRIDEFCQSIATK